MKYTDVVAAWYANNESSRLWNEITDRERVEFALSLAGKAEKQEPVAWNKGYPTNPWGTEWFIARTKGGARVVLRKLPDEFTYDFTTADNTYYKKEVITRWMQFPDSEFISPTPCPECEKLKALSVTNILIDVVPGDGSGLEIYAKSVSDVEALLSRLGEKAEDYDLLKPEYEKLKVGLPIRDQFFCADCQDTGWLQNRVEGKYPCTCMTEAEPYQLLEAERDELTRQVAHWKANHKSVVEQARILKERPDMPIERVKAYENWVAMAEQVAKMRDALESFLTANDPTEFGCACDPSVGYSCGPCSTHKRQTVLREALALPDISTGILNQVRAEALLKAADLVHEQAANAVADAIGGDAYDCTRVWSAWSYGTMGSDDFVSIIDQQERINEISEAVLETLRALAADMEAGKC